MKRGNLKKKRKPEGTSTDKGRGDDFTGNEKKGRDHKSQQQLTKKKRFEQ